VQLIVVAVRARQTKVLPNGRIEYVGILCAEADHTANLIAGMSRTSTPPT
jgi:hypothetical protein